MMYDSLLFHIGASNVGDIAIVDPAVDDSSTMVQSLPMKFIQVGNVQISPVLHFNDFNTDVIAYVLLALLGMMAVIWYFFPERFSMIFPLRSESQLQRVAESSAKVPGTLITVFLWLNFMVSAGIFILLVLHRFFEKEITGLSDYMILGYVVLVLGGLLLYRFVIIFGAAFIFQTQKMMKQQVVSGRNIQLVTGMFLVPAILLMLYAGGSFIVYIAIAAVVPLQVFRLVQIVIIGKSSAIFSALHIILYICTLEIVPVLVLMGLIGNGSGI